MKRDPRNLLGALTGAAILATGSTAHAADVPPKRGQCSFEQHRLAPSKIDDRGAGCAQHHAGGSAPYST